MLRAVLESFVQGVVRPSSPSQKSETRNTVRYNLAVIAEPCVRLLSAVTSLHKAQQWGRSNTSETGSLPRLPVQRASYLWHREHAFITMTKSEPVPKMGKSDIY